MFWVGFENKLQVTAAGAAAASISRLLTSLLWTFLSKQLESSSSSKSSSSRRRMATRSLTYCVIVQSWFFFIPTQCSDMESTVLLWKWNHSVLVSVHPVCYFCLYQCYVFLLVLIFYYNLIFFWSLGALFDCFNKDADLCLWNRGDF